MEREKLPTSPRGQCFDFSLIAPRVRRATLTPGLVDCLQRRCISLRRLIAPRMAKRIRGLPTLL